MGEINCLDEPCSVITVILSPLVRVPLSCLEKRARREGKGGMCWGWAAPAEESTQGPLRGARSWAWQDLGL